MVITIECPSCADTFPVDPAKIPEAGVKARCSSCGEIFRIERPAEEPAPSAVAEPEVAAPPEAIEAEETVEAVEEETVVEEPEAEEPSEPMEAEEPIARDDFAAVTEEPAAESDFGALEEPADEPLAEAPTKEAEADSADSPGDWVIETEVEVDAAELEVEPVGTVEEEAHAALDENAFFVGAGGVAADTADEAVTDYDEGAIELAEEPTIEITEEPAEAAAEVTDDLPSFSFGDDAAVADDVATDDELPSFDDAPTEEVLDEAPAFEEASFEEVAVEETVIEEAVVEEVVVEEAPTVEESTEEPEPEPEPEPAVTGFTFGKRDPKDKAKRLARVLVSDMIEYNRDRHTSALAAGTLKEDFEEEIEKSWKEYVEQVGAEMAEGDGQEFWRAALNDVLAQGEELF